MRFDDRHLRVSRAYIGSLLGRDMGVKMAPNKLVDSHKYAELEPPGEPISRAIESFLLNQQTTYNAETSIREALEHLS
jgi:hypothetical protein